eukprot:9424574-Pyramimonas_sp.AAC.1
MRGDATAGGTAASRRAPPAAAQFAPAAGGKETSSLKNKCRVLFGILTGMTTAQIHQHYGTNHKMIEDMARALDLARKQCVEKYETDIARGGGKKWAGAEACESVFATAAAEDKGAN